MMRVNLPHRRCWLTDRSLITNDAWHPLQLLVFDWCEVFDLCARSPLGRWELAAMQWWGAVKSCGRVDGKSDWQNRGRVKLLLGVCCVLSLCVAVPCCCEQADKTLAPHRLKCSYIILPSRLACSRPISQNASEQQWRGGDGAKVAARRNRSGGGCTLHATQVDLTEVSWRVLSGLCLLAIFDPKIAKPKIWYIKKYIKLIDKLE